MKRIPQDGETVVITRAPIACPRCGRAAEPVRDVIPTWSCAHCGGMWREDTEALAVCCDALARETDELAARATKAEVQLAAQLRWRASATRVLAAVRAYVDAETTLDRDLASDRPSETVSTWGAYFTLREAIERHAAHEASATLPSDVPVRDAAVDPETPHGPPENHQPALRRPMEDPHYVALVQIAMADGAEDCDCCAHTHALAEAALRGT